MSIIPVIILGELSYWQSSKEIQSKVNHEKVQSIQQIRSNLEHILLTVNHSLNTLMESSTMDKSLDIEMVANDFKIHRQLRKELVNLQSMNTNVVEMILLNKKKNWVMTNSSLQRLSEYPDQERLLSYFDLPSNAAWVLLKNENFTESIGSSNCDYTVSLVKKLPAMLSEKYGLAFVNIPTCSLANLINVDQKSDEFMIVDENYKIIVHKNQDLIGKSLIESGHFKSIKEFEEKEGQFNTTYEDSPYVVTYSKSDFNQWTYISFNSIDHLTSESKKIGWFTTWIALGIILISIIFVLIVTKRLYSPVDRIVTYIEDHFPESPKGKKDELTVIEERVKTLFSSNTMMENELTEHVQQVQALFFNRLYQGSYGTREIKEKLDYFNLLGKVKQWDSYTVLSLQIDTLEDTVYQQKDMELLSFAISNIVEETLDKENNRIPTVWVDQTLAIFIGFSNKTDEEIETKVYEITEKLMDNIEKWLKISVSIGISLPFQEIKKASRAFEEGLEALKHRIRLGKGVIIHFSSINTRKHSLIFEYPVRTQEELTVAIKLGEEERSIMQLSIWMKKVFQDNQTPREYQIALMRLLNHLLVIKQENNISFQQIGVYNSSLYEELLTLQMKDPIEEWFKERIVVPLCQVFYERRNSQFQNLSEKIIDLIHNYYDQELTLEDCAERLHYNANYLSSVFKQETNHTFSEYLANYRFKLAKQWLIETDMTVKEIADKLQYKNSQNFIRSFKKQEAITPGQYREKYRNIS